jgi:protein gp37
MSDKSKIEWTDATWNPVRGCTKISPGCKHCYAEVFAERFRGVPGHPYERGFDLRLVPEKLQEPLKRKSSRLVFVNSMSDLFHENVPDDYIVKVAEVMSTANWHTFQVLTKRSDRMRDLLNSKLQFAAHHAHIWWGVSVEDRKHGLPRVAANASASLRKTGCQGILLRGEVVFIEVDAKALNPLKTTSIHNAARMVESCATNPIRGGPARKPM